MKYSRQSLWVGAVAVEIMLAGCAGDDAGEPNAHYVAAETAMKNGCGSRSSSCHAEGGEAAMFDIGAAIAAGDMRSAMVNIPSCEYDVLDIVEPGSPDDSWLMVKITGDFVDDPGTMQHGDLEFTPDPSWSEADKCNSSIRGFGKRMPNVSPFQIPASLLTDIRTWIEMGAPGPTDP